jgi:hypothetical protein
LSTVICLAVTQQQPLHKVCVRSRHVIRPLSDCHLLPRASPRCDAPTHPQVREKAIADQFEARRAKNKASRERKAARREERLTAVSVCVCFAVTWPRALWLRAARGARVR